MAEPNTEYACPNCGSTNLDTLEIATCVANCERITARGPEFTGYTEYDRGSQRTVGVWCNECEWQYIVPEWRDIFAKVEAPSNENEWLTHLVPARIDGSGADRG